MSNKSMSKQIMSSYSIIKLEFKPKMPLVINHPSPSQGEGWDGGVNHMKLPHSTPTLTLPLPWGGDKTAQDKFGFTPVMQSPLHHFGLAAKQEPVNEGKGVWANEIALLGYICLRGNAQNAAFLEAAEAALGSALPTQACSFVATNWGNILWLAPDEWLLTCAREHRASLQLILEAALAGVHSQVVDNSGGFTSVVLQGKNARDALSHCTVYDLHALSVGKVVGSTFGKASVFMHRNNKGYTLIFRRSFADYIWRYLERAAAPYGFGIATL